MDNKENQDRDMNYGGIGMDKFAHMGIGGMMASALCMPWWMRTTRIS